MIAVTGFGFEDPCLSVGACCVRDGGRQARAGPRRRRGAARGRGRGAGTACAIGRSHAFAPKPAGSFALSLPRRLALLSWASANGAFVVEDDYDSEFRYVGRPLPALKSIDRMQRVLYAGSFSKVLFPSLRLGYLVIPEELMETFAQSCRRRHSGASTLTPDARSRASWLTVISYAVIRRMRGLYAARREALAEALSVAFGNRVQVDLKPGGMHLIARFADGVRDVASAKRAQAAGLAVEALYRAARSPILAGRGCCWGSRILPRRMRKRYACGCSAPSAAIRGDSAFWLMEPSPSTQRSSGGKSCGPDAPTLMR